MLLTENRIYLTFLSSILVQGFSMQDCKLIKTHSLQLFFPLYPPVISLDSVLEFVSHYFYLTRDLSSRSYFLTNDLCFLESTKLNFMFLMLQSWCQPMIRCFSGSLPPVLKITSLFSDCINLTLGFGHSFAILPLSNFSASCIS